MQDKRRGRPPGPRSKAEIAADANRSGRPPKLRNDVRNARINLSMTQKMYAKLKVRAKRADSSLSSYIISLIEKELGL